MMLCSKKKIPNKNVRNSVPWCLKSIESERKKEYSPIYFFPMYSVYYNEIQQTTHRVKGLLTV